MSRIKAFAIFEGGGARGIAHVGALKATEDGYEFLGVAGTSAGAIVAALVAAGCKADDIFEPHRDDTILGLDFTQLLADDDWKVLYRIRERLRRDDESTQASPTCDRRLLIRILPACLCSLLCLLLYICGAGFFRYNIVLGVPVLCAVILALFAPCSVYLWGVAKRWGPWIVDLVRVFICSFNLPGLRTGPYANAALRGGIASTGRFETWLNKTLAEKLHNDGLPGFGGEGRVVTFADLRIPLKVIAADVEQKKIRVFQAPGDGSVSVAAAVCASISIPFVFEPKVLLNKSFVDGGIMSNFPAWVFDDERDTAPRMTPTIGFRLAADSGSGFHSETRFGFFRHLGDVALSAAFGDNSLETRRVAELCELPIECRMGLLDFDATNDVKTAVYNDAYRQATKALNARIHRVPSEKMRGILGMVVKLFRQDVCFSGHLRVNVMLPLDNRRIQVAYSINMEDSDSPDDRMILEGNQGAAGLCWKTGSHVVVDMLKAASSWADVWKMDKYQQASVRQSLRTLLSIPLIDRRRGKSEVIGVLNFDSDEDIEGLCKEWAKSPNSEAAAALVVGQLLNWRLV